MKTRRFRPGMDHLSSRIVPSNLGPIVGGLANPYAPAVQQGPSGQTAPGTLPLAPPFCGGGTSSGSATATTSTAVIATTALVA